MKSFVGFFFVFVLLMGCSNPPETPERGIEVVQRFSDGSIRIDQMYETHEGKKVAYFQREYKKDGSLYKAGPLKNGKVHGLWKSYYSNGILWSEGAFEEGNRNGISVTYHSNGKKYYQGYFTQNVKDSIWLFWREDGSLIKEVDFRK